jgi:hypothetical protein
VFDLEALEGGFIGYDLLQHLTEFRDIPLAVSEIT